MTKHTLGPIRAWSFSSLQSFEQCPHRMKLKVVDKLPLPPTDPNSPLERGNRIHKAAEDFIQGLTDTLDPALAKHMAQQYHAMRELFAQGKVTVEEEWAYTRTLEPTDWRAKDAWVRAKLDCCVQLNAANEVLVQDHKTGKLFGNEVKHAQQGMFYAGLAALRYPEAQRFHVEFWYPDVNDLTHTVFNRRQADVFRNRFIERGEKMTTATEFPARPNESNCRYCDFGCNKGTGACEYDHYKGGVKAVQPYVGSKRKSIL